MYVIHSEILMALLISSRSVAEWQAATMSTHVEPLHTATELLIPALGVSWNQSRELADVNVYICCLSTCSDFLFIIFLNAPSGLLSRIRM